ncbi:glycosyltransferase family 4 protein [Sphingobacterium bovistauri]|uniref:Glycosyltransferase family 4 protein n=1 Tax=Sphingobacterium bovistauri TaxID=2781959 RepID=A0ABS7Z8E3_9SPHI|nr:glycosyltransferase family 4 protein [Sphingobacterium bovistauri]MCA5006424.1 glycosyltransferase family 4 protein [Sphingobacterium bovistauri]
MRILIVHNYYQHKGGEDVLFQQEVEALRKHHQVETITFQNLKGFEGLKQFALYPWNIFAANRILQKAKGFNAEIIHFHNIHYAIGPFAIRKLYNAGFKIVMTLHNYRLICPSATLFFDGKLFTASLDEDFPITAVKKKVLDRSWVKTLITACVYYFHRKMKTWDMVHKYIVLSNFAKETFRVSPFGVEQSKLEVKPNFVPTPTILEKNPQPNFIYIGRLSEEKGIIPLLEAIKNTEYHIKILGTGPQLEEVLTIVNNSSNIEYLGFLSQEDVTKELNNSSALVFPSICYEGMPMTIIESFALGIPVLCSNIGILEQMVTPNYTGLHFDIHNKKSILDTLDLYTKLSEDDKKRISINCKNEYSSNYTEQKNIQFLNSLYSKAIEENNI